MAQAQPGIRGGMNFATLSTLNWDGASRDAQVAGKAGWQLGVFYQQPLAGRWSLVPELQYSYQRLDLQVEDNSVNDGSYAGHYALSLGYLHVPMWVRAAFRKGYLEVGPQLSMLVNAHETGTETMGSFFGSTTSAVDRPAGDRYARADVALGIGGGVQLTNTVDLSLRISAGLLSLTSEYAAPYNYGGSLRNQVAQLSLSYQFKKPVAE
ncbi:hypothetical protein GCM10022409_49300 [Hymenobacter glaciei]|uniref:Outer membrane protein beta-barrel domain-containing protein n=1 Tax=Hymenobacter glaciei TaxID=877209 RepID=A0ABP7UZD1_9BACT